MKKTIALLAALSLSVSLLAGCGSSASSSAASSSEAASSEAASSSAAADGDLDYIKGNGKMVIGYTVYAPMNYTDDEGNDKLYIPSGKCVLTAPGAGRTAYGAVSQVEQSDGEFHTYAGRRVPKYVSSAEGNSRTLTISSRPLMIPNNKNPFIVADVLTD